MPDQYDTIVELTDVADENIALEWLSDDFYPRSIKSIVAHHVQNEIVLHDDREGQLIALNATGRAVWELCDGSNSISEIARILSDSFDAPIAILLKDIKIILADLNERNLIELSKVETGRQTDVATEIIRIEFNSCQVHVHTDIDEIKDWLRRRFQAMLTQAPGRVVGNIGISKINGDYHVSGCRRLQVPESSFREVRRGVKHQIDRDLFEAQPNFIWLHAGAVATGNGAVVLGGKYGSGKSTVIVNLYRRGWTYLSDDIIPLDPVTGSVRPFPLTPMYRVNDGEYVTEEKITDLKRIWVDLDPDTVGREPARVCGFVFPRYDLSVDAQMERLQPGEAVVELIQHCINFKYHGGEAVRGLSTLIDGRKIFRLLYSDGEAAARLVEDEFGS